MGQTTADCPPYGSRKISIFLNVFRIAILRALGESSSLFSEGVSLKIVELVPPPREHY
jgi:hypothetical protein